ncbi:LPS translocon maturation chaperone LptM [Polynucleobacter brandtiae]|uniref:Putative lipoprotein n=1 Tax=Polynucleobacter brandtiae TaxID=1938816 RepID=A0A2M8VRR0_9BURK|nr:putative lipoprotein [Polynucleobacter brandtiae]
MIATLISTLGISLLISLAGCGVRGPLYLPNVPAAPTPPPESEPKGKLYPPQSPTVTNSTPAK